MNGRKIYALVDSEGLPMRGIVHSAAIQDRDGRGWSSTETQVIGLLLVDTRAWARRLGNWAVSIFQPQP